MANRAKLELGNLEKLGISLAEKEEIKKFIKSNPHIKERVDKIQKVLKEKFYLSEIEMENYILKICEDESEKDVFFFQDIFEEFEKNDVENFNAEERKKQAENIIFDVYDLYKSQTRKVGEDFVDCMREAKRIGIDPFRFAIKTNIEKANCDKFQETLNALTAKYDARYFKKKPSEKEEQLFSHDETKAILDQCMTLAMQLNSELVELVLITLNDLTYDKKNGMFYADVREFIRKAPSILLANPENMYATISNLQTYYKKMGKTQEDLVQRVLQSPSVLCADSKDIDSTINLLAKNYQSLISQLPEKVRRGKDARVMAEAFAYDVTNLSQIKSLKTESLGKMQDILVKYLGAENALTCFQNMEILNKAPAIVEYALAVISTSPNSKELREKFIKSPNTFLEEKKDFTQSSSDNEGGEGTERKTFFANKETLPEVNLSKEEIENLKSKVSKKDLKTLQEKIDAEKEHLAALQREFEEEKRRRREEKKAKKKESKLKAKNDKPVQIIKMQNPSEQEDQPQLSYEEKMRKRLSYLWPPRKGNLRSGEVPHKDFENIYEPIFKVLDRCGFELDLPKYKDVKEIFKKYDSLAIDSMVATQLSILYGSIFKGLLSEGVKTPIIGLLSSTEDNEIRKMFTSVSDIADIKENAHKYLIKVEENDTLANLFIKYADSAYKATKDVQDRLFGLVDKMNEVSQEPKFSENMTVNFRLVERFLKNYIQECDKQLIDLIGQEKYDQYFDEDTKKIKNAIENGVCSNKNIKPINSPVIVCKGYVAPALDFIKLMSRELKKTDYIKQFDGVEEEYAVIMQSKYLDTIAGKTDEIKDKIKTLPGDGNMLVLKAKDEQGKEYRVIAINDGEVIHQKENGEDKKINAFTIAAVSNDPNYFGDPLFYQISKRPSLVTLDKSGSFGIRDVLGLVDVEKTELKIDGLDVSNGKNDGMGIK